MSECVLDNLHNLLGEQLELLDALGEVVNTKQRILVACKLEDLLSLSERENTLALQLAECEARRLNAVAGIEAEGLLAPGPEPCNLPLGALIPRLPLAQQPRFLKSAGELRVAAEKLRQLNELNEVLTLNLLDYSAMVMRLLTQDGAPSHYGSTGRVQDAPSRAMLDSRV